MKLIIYEYVSGGGYAGQAIPQGLLAEGYAMLRSVAADFKAAGHKVTVLLDGRISKLNPHIGADCTVPVLYANEPQRFLSNIAKINDAVYIIAPETGKTLQKLVKSIEETGKTSFNCASDAIGKVADKEVLYKHLAKNDISTPKTLILNFNNSLKKITEAINQELTYPVVLKPLDGAGCSGMSIVKTENAIEAAIAKIRTQSASTHFIAQGFINGLPASVSVISNGQKAVAISLNKQTVTIAQPEGESCYVGGCVPLEHVLCKKAFALAEKLVESISGLRGYVGVDVVLSEDTVFVVDVNPRLTTSYVGLHEVSDFNVAQAIIDAVTAAKLPKKIQNQSVVYFSKCETAKPTLESFQKMDKTENICAPPFPLDNQTNSYALIMSRGVSMQDACLRLEEAKKSFRSIMG